MYARRQVAALPLRRTPEGLVEVLLVTSRDTGRWIIPKGWPSKRLSDGMAAAREAWQEAGVKGKIASEAIGSYRYVKAELGFQAIDVSVFVLEVTEEHQSWREMHQRRREWFKVTEAAAQICEPELAGLIEKLNGVSGCGPIQVP